MNLLPIPVLDGGTLVFCLIEGITRRPVKLKTQAVFQNVGMALLFSLLAFTLVNDISRLFGR
jgi:regulator of sigma E protease